jgi:hypothetical protein
MPNWVHDEQAELEEVKNAVNVYIRLLSFDEVARYLEQTQKLLLTNAASKILQVLVEYARKERPEAEINQLELRQRLLERARAIGVQKAVEDEKHHQDEVGKSVVAFLSSSLTAMRQVWEEHHRILCTREAIRYTQRLVEQLDKSDQDEDPVYQRGRALKIRFLQDARERGVDYAEEQLRYNFAQLWMQTFDNLHRNDNR